MRFKGIKFGVAEILEVAAATAYFVNLALVVVLWQPGSWGWGFLIHMLTLFCLGASLFSFSLSGYRIRRPVSLPEMLLFLVFLYEIINAGFSKVPCASFEMLLFFLDGMILFYVGTTLFARRHEGFLSLMILFVIGIGSILLFTEHGNSWKAPMDPVSVYRGKKMLVSSMFEHPLLGCGTGTLPFLRARYLPLGDRYPPNLNPLLGIILAEQGFIGALFWMTALLGIIFSLFRKQEGNKKEGRLKTICFGAAVMMGGFFLFSIFLPLSLSLPLILYAFMPLCGIAIILRQGKAEPIPEGENRFQKHKLRYSLAILIPLFIILLLEMAPLTSTLLVRFDRVSDLGTRGYGTRISLARFLMPYNPEIYLMQAKHLRAKAAGDPGEMILSIELAYLRALQKNPYNERYYLEYAHFLDLARDYPGMVSTLEKGIEKCPGSVEIRMLLFRGYMNTGNRREALDTLNSLRRYYPLDYASHERLARYYAEAGAQAASSEERILALQLSPIFTPKK
jgi:hypothetical protein